MKNFAIAVLIAAALTPSAFSAEAMKDLSTGTTLDRLVLPAPVAAPEKAEVTKNVDFSGWRTLKATTPTDKGPVWLQGDNPYGDVFISEGNVIYNTSMSSGPLTKEEKASLAKAIEAEIKQGSRFSRQLSIALAILNRADI